MSSEARRRELVRILRQSSAAVTGAQLSDILGVTRQVVVADIAVLRAAGEEIIATPQGYLYTQPVSCRQRRTLASRHSSLPEDIQRELYIVVDQGATVVDVIIEHPLYGEITGNLHLGSRHAVDVFIAKLTSSGAEPLSVLTGGLHLHTIEAEDGATLARVMEELHKHGFLETG